MKKRILFVAGLAALLTLVASGWGASSKARERSHLEPTPTVEFAESAVPNQPAVAAAPLLPPDQGPGGPILIITTGADPFSKYYAEILRAEGLNAFALADIAAVTSVTLATYDVALLAAMPLSAAQATMLATWVDEGGNLIAMRPDTRLAGLLGLRATGSTLGNGYLLVKSAGLGAGIVGQSIQFHGSADLYTLNGATPIATLYSNATTPTAYPAVTFRDVGEQGGQAAAFTYDLARAIVYIRQGNPAWAGQERDGIPPIRATDLFYGAAASDPQADWLDLSKIAIPQADEQQRLLANIILALNRDRKPLPRFWYFPRGEKAVVILTGDGHGHAQVAAWLNWYKTLSPAGCSVQEWECVRSSAYFETAIVLTNEEAQALNADGFDLGAHVTTGCANWTPASLAAAFSTQMSAWRAKYTSLPPPVGGRTHCVAWSDWATHARVDANNGIRMDGNYLYPLPPWDRDHPGLMTGSAIPMRFADLNGAMIDVYQIPYPMADEVDQSWPATIDTLLDRALGPEGYYGAFSANVHVDYTPDYPGQSPVAAAAIIASAQARSVPVVSMRQMLTWLDGRNNSAFGNLTWSGNALDFTVAIGSGANGLWVMLPTRGPIGGLEAITLDDAAVGYSVQTIKGVEYAMFPAAAGAYHATYRLESTATPTRIATSTPTFSATSTHTATPSATPRATPTPTATTRPNTTPTPSATPTPTATTRPNTTPTPSATPTPTATTRPNTAPTPSATLTRTATPSATPRSTSTPTTIVATATPTQVLIASGPNLLSTSWLWALSAGAATGHAAASGTLDIQATAAASACWYQDIAGAPLRNQTVRFEAAMRKTAPMNQVTPPFTNPYISLQVRKGGGSWLYNFGGVLNSRSVPGSGWVSEARDILLPNDMTTLRAAFCVWNAMPGAAEAQNLLLRRTVAPPPPPTNPNLLSANWAWTPASPGVSGSSPGDGIFTINATQAGARGCWVQDLPGAPLRNKVVRYEAAMSKSANMSAPGGVFANPYISLQVRRTDGSWYYNFPNNTTLNSTAIPGGPFVTQWRNYTLPADMVTLRAAFCVWDAAPGVAAGKNFLLQQLVTAQGEEPAEDTWEEPGSDAPSVLPEDGVAQPEGQMRFWLPVIRN